MAMSAQILVLVRPEATGLQSTPPRWWLQSLQLELQFRRQDLSPKQLTVGSLRLMCQPIRQMLAGMFIGAGIEYLHPQATGGLSTERLGRARRL